MPIEIFYLIVYTIKKGNIMNEVELREFANIQKELEKLLVKFEELNKKHEELKKSINKNNKKEVEELLSKLELQYAIVDNKMKELVKRSEQLKNSTGAK